MSSPKAAVTLSELTRYAKAMRAAGFDSLRMEFETTDGRKVSIFAGENSEASAVTDDFDKLIGKVPDAPSSSISWSRNDQRPAWQAALSL